MIDQVYTGEFSGDVILRSWVVMDPQQKALSLEINVQAQSPSLTRQIKKWKQMTRKQTIHR